MLPHGADSDRRWSLSMATLRCRWQGFVISRARIRVAFDGLEVVETELDQGLELRPVVSDILTSVVFWIYPFL